MAQLELPNLPERPMNPELLLGAASPLWGYYGAAAASGVAYWWMTRWAQPMNLEALFGMALQTSAPPTLPAAEVPEVEVLPVVGGESAPISPLMVAAGPPVEAIVEAPAELLVDAVVEATAAEPAAEASPEAVAVEPEAPTVAEEPGEPASTKARKASGEI